MVGPFTVDLQVGAGPAFLFEAQARKQLGAAQVLGAVVGHDPMQLQFIEGMADGRLQGFVHQAPALGVSGQGETQVAGLERTSHDVGEVAGAQYALLVAIEQQPVSCLLCGDFACHVP